MAWLYVPGLEGSNSGLSAPSEMPTGLSVAWNGKPVQPRSWSRVSKTGLFRRFLSGTLLPPSTVSNGLDSWISSLRASRVSPSPWLVSGQAPKTSAISGPISQGSSESASRDSSSLRTFRGSSQLGLPMDGAPTSTSRPIYEAWVTQLRLASSRRQKSARRTSGNGSSSWPTARSEDSESAGNHPGATDSLTGATAEWATPTVGVVTGGQNPTTGGQMGIRWQALNWAAAHGAELESATPSTNWPTPDTQNHRDGSVRREEQKGSHALSLHHAVDAWATPTQSMTTGAGTEGRDGGPNLQTQSEQWATPTSRDWKDGTNPSENVPTNALLGRQAPRYSHLGPESESDGQPSSESGQTSRRQLNPKFVELLMGLPENWTSAVPSACDSLAMESYRCRLHMHFARFGGD